ncbi:unnamed protein product [Caenorhabditis auriculariae]|uniref:Uncharacterized protein n=1 Tax=Caenorhabditis auriculariae TaxID=2777116 RepID=A0A8S1HED1_9PELO|nr:unnamed protein product [Caenorhabditis auriculariae]
MERVTWSVVNQNQEVMHWKATTLLICMYGIVKELRPATPFLTPYLVTEKKLTPEVVYSQVYPFWTYSYMIALIPIFFLTDILRYKPIIILEAFSLAMTWALLVWGKGVFQMQLMQILFGISSASEIAYYCYMYAVVEEKNYHKVTSYIRSAALLGKLFAFATGQILISTQIGSYLLLNQISFAAVSTVTVIAIFLPRVESRRTERQTHVAMMLLNSQEPENAEQPSRAQIERSKMDSGLRNYMMNTLLQVKTYSRSSQVLKWSPLWLEMQPDAGKVENGIVEFCNTFIGVLLSFAAQYFGNFWKHGEEKILSLSSFAISAILLYVASTNYIIGAYVGYIAITSIYHLLITLASFHISTQLSALNHGLIFGINTFAAVFLQSILTFVVVNHYIFQFNIRQQFLIYSGYFATVGFIFLIFAACSYVIVKRLNHRTTVVASE